MMSDLDKALYYLNNATNVNGCFICHVKPAPHGYCQTTGGRRIHRLVYQELKGDIGDLLVLHRCDNRRCINPKHLFLGTQKDNMEDMASKSRKADTTGNCRAVTLDTAEKIYQLYKNGNSQRRIASMYNISQSTVGNIIHGHRGYANVQRS
jgi:hypothetical protein